MQIDKEGKEVRVFPSQEQVEAEIKRYDPKLKVEGGSKRRTSRRKRRKVC